MIFYTGDISNCTSMLRVANLQIKKLVVYKLVFCTSSRVGENVQSVCVLLEYIYFRILCLTFKFDLA